MESSVKNRQIIQELSNVFLYDNPGVQGDFSSGFMAGVEESLLVIANSEGWTKSQIKEYFYKIL